MTALLAAPAAHAEIAGEQVVSGTATFDQSGNVITITASDGAIINYGQFGVRASEEMHFVQPASESRVLNRVFGDATHIDGGLYANGIVYIVNPAGVYFGSGAIVDVGGLYAAAGDISNEDFRARIDRFTLSGAVDNAGSIESPAVALLGTQIANHGNIHAPDGTIALVAGEKVILTQLGAHLAVEVEGVGGSAEAPAIEQAGSVDAGAGAVSYTTGDVYSLAINHTGITRGREIELRAESGTVQVAGTLDASNRSAGATGGSIAVTGERVALLGAQLDASGDAGGGEIRVGGDLHGEGALPTARRTYVDDGSSLRADAIAEGDGGRVIVWADEATAFHGAASARGGAAGGDGGFAEISGAAFLAADGDVDLGAPSGATGTLLYDPKEIVVHGGSVTGSPAPDDSDSSDVGLTGSQLGTVLFGDTAALDEPFDIYESEIEGTNANIVLEATHRISSSGTFSNDAAGEGTGVVRITDGNSLTMRTRNDPDDATGATNPIAGIDLTGVSFQTTGSGTITFETGTGTGTGTGVTANIHVGNLTTGGGAVSAKTFDDGAITVANVTTAGADGATGGAGGAVTLAAGGTGSVTADAVDASGGVGTSGAGGAGGAVRITTVDGAIAINGVNATTLASVDTSGGNGATSGGAGGAINLLAKDIQPNLTTPPDSDVTVAGDLLARGGNGTSGAGGVGGPVLVRSDGTLITPFPSGSTQQAIAGGGDLSLHGVDARGGDSTTIGGGRGGAVRIETTDGAIHADDITTSGGNGATTGGSAGTIAIVTRDANGDNANASIDVGALSAVGGVGTAGAGGAGALIDVRTQGSQRIVQTKPPIDPLPDPPLVLQETQGGGNINIASIDTTGGTGHNTADTGLGGRGGAVTLTAGTGSATSNLHVGNIDASEGGSDPNAAITSTDGGDVTLEAGGDIALDGQSGPHIRTGGSVSLTAGGSIGTVEIEGKEVDGRAENVLTVSAGTTANVDVTNVGFLGALIVSATSDAADIHVTQSGGDVIDMSGSGVGTHRVVVNEVDTVGNRVAVQVRFENPDEDATEGTLVLATGASPSDPVITPGDTFQARSDGDIEVGTADGTVIRAAEPDPDASTATAGAVILIADQDFDGDGAIRAFSDRAVIDMLGAADNPGELNLYAGDRIGADGHPIIVAGGARVSASSGLIQDPAHSDLLIPNPAADSGIFVRNVASEDAPSSDLSLITSTFFSRDLRGAEVRAGSGEIDITNEVGDLIVTGIVSAKPSNPTTDGAGGNVRLAAAGEIVLNTASAIESGGVQNYDGNVVLGRATTVTADGGVDINGGLDTRDTAANPVGFTATLGDEATDVTKFSVSGGIGDTRALGSFALRAPDGGKVALKTPLVRTTGSQTYSADLDLAQFTTLDAGTQIRFDKAGEQIVTGPAGFSLGTSGVPISPEATIAKPNGNLKLESTGGSILIGDGEKLSVAGSLAISAPTGTARFTDLSALDITVTSPDAQVFARAPAPVATPSGATIQDGGTDLVANTVAFSSAPTIVGGGPAPRIATPSGTAQNAGALPVGTLPVPISAADIAAGSRVFDLAIPAIDPGHETQEIPTSAVEPALEPQPSRDRAAPGAPVTREEVAAFFACAPLGAEAMPASCTAAPALPAYGSALDTERAVEIARAYRELLGDSPDAAAGRASLAHAAADPRAEVGQASSPSGRVYLTEVARVLGQVRLLGLGERYGEVRADVLAAVAAAIGSPQLDAARLGKAVDARAMGMPIQVSAAPPGG